MAVPVVVSASQSDRERSIATIVTAFTADPVMRWMLPEPSQYLQYFPRAVELFAGGAFAHASAYRTEDFGAAALWLPPGVHPDEEALGPVLQEAINETLQEEAFAMLELMGASHPEEEHWYLPVIGVDPWLQGKGYGSALLQHALEVCDREHGLAYLESSNPRNNPLYERFGFEVQATLQVGSSPPVWPMRRPAR